MAWVDQSSAFGYGSVLTSTQMQNLRDNLTALANGDTGAPLIQQAAIDTNSVGQSEIKIASSYSDSGTGNAVSFYVNPGGIYAVGGAPSVGFTAGTGGGEYATSGLGTLGAWWDGSTVNTASTGVAHGSFISYAWIGQNTTFDTVRGYLYYIQASPPYDLGDGVCGRFVFVKLDQSGNILEVWSAPEAPWHHNGPTDLTPDFYVDKKPFRVLADLPFSMKEAANDSTKLSQLLAAQQQIRDFAAQQSVDLRKEFAMRNLFRREKELALAAAMDSQLPFKMVEIDQTMKQADMAIVPHPFTRMNSGETVVMLDAVTDDHHKLSDLEDVSRSEFTICDLLRNGYLKIDNTPLQRSGPPGVQIVTAKWSITP